MKRVGAGLVLIIVTASGLASPTATSAASPTPPTDPAPFVAAFGTWAISNGGPVTVPACHTPTAEETQIVVCYGIGDGRVVIAVVDIDDSGAPGDIAELAIPTETPTAPTDAAGTIPATSSAEPATTFGPGVQVVGSDVPPGTYTATVPADSNNCYWERLSGFSGELEDTITNDNAEVGEQVIVEIDPTDVGFSSNGCGTWTLLQ